MLHQEVSIEGFVTQQSNHHAMHTHTHTHTHTQRVLQKKFLHEVELYFLAKILMLKMNIVLRKGS